MINDFSISRSAKKNNAIVIRKHDNVNRGNFWSFIRISDEGLICFINVYADRGYYITKNMDLLHTKKGNSIVRIVGVDDL
jgi:hypothetical protein